ncbi:MAG TPA: SPOR domain-containing protein [Steroidobacteraceae bacterium]|jgi:outer membrane protein assembly factor BamD (BamD/ComL family)|nr:SPOR domain-containing protein [Steroidobacteraceae bacterium]
MKNLKNVTLGLSLLAAIALAACSSSEADWNQANTQGTVAAYQGFLSKHPNDQHDAAARTRIQTLQDDEAWKSAQTTNTVDSYQQYVTAQPNGAHVQDAHDRITGFERASAWQSAKTDGSEAALQAFLQKYPQGPEADQARDQLQQLSYRVQLGAFRSNELADKARARLQDRYGKDLQNVVVVPPTGKSKTYHVASADMTQDQAKSACASLRKAHQSCEVVKREGG